VAEVTHSTTQPDPSCVDALHTRGSGMPAARIGGHVTDIARDGDLALNGSAHWVLQKTPGVCSAVLEQSMPNPDAHVVEPAAQSPGMDRAAVERLIAKHYTGLRLLIQRRTGDAEIAADILNQAACTAWEKWQSGQVRRPEEIGGYIFQVAMNLLRNRRRKVVERADRHVDSEVLGHLPADADAADRWLEKKIAARVKRVLQDLPLRRDREILVRFYLQEEEKDAICRDLGIEADHFDKVLHRARGRLKELLEASGLQRSDFFMLCL
jgi:RNA polymerase sigma-70 factor (ECF subfamily)